MTSRALVSYAAPARWATPAALTPLTALTQLQLRGQTQLGSGTNLLELCLQPLAQLLELHLKACGLAAVPAALSHCTQLVSLALSYNRLAGGWENLGHLSRLVALDMSGCGAAPAAIPHLPAPRLLRHLGLARCDLAEVPTWVSALTALIELNLGSNEIRGGWDHLRPLVHLERLSLFGNRFHNVPAAVSVLTALTALDLGYPSGGWFHLRPLARLASLDTLGGWQGYPEHYLELAADAAQQLHPAAVQRMMAQRRGDLRQLLAELDNLGLPRPF